MSGDHGSQESHPPQRRTTTFQVEEPSETSHPTTLRQGTDLSRRTSRISFASIRRTLTMNFKPEKKVGEAPGLLQSIRAIITASCTPHFACGLYTPTLTFFPRAQSVAGVYTSFGMFYSQVKLQISADYLLSGFYISCYPRPTRMILLFSSVRSRNSSSSSMPLIYSCSLLPGNYPPRKGCP